MKRYLLLLAACVTFHAAPAQLLNRLKERAAGAVQSVGAKGQNAVAGKANETTEKEAIIFSKEPFKEGQTTGTATDFLPTDNIYARVVLPRTIFEDLEEHGKEDQASVDMRVGLTSDVQEGLQTITRYNYCTLTIPQADFKKKYFDLDVLPALNHLTTRYVGTGGTKDHISSIFSYFGEEAPPSFPFGKRRFKLEFGVDQGSVGYFTLTVNNFKEKKPLDARVNAIRSGINAAVAKDTKLPEIFRTGGSKFADPALSTANLKKLLGTEVLRFAVAPGPDYIVRKNELGIPTRKVTKSVWIVFKDEGNCYYTEYMFQRSYEGGGKYGELQPATSLSPHVLIACENAK